MPLQLILKKIILNILKLFLSVKRDVSFEIGNPKKIIVIRQHNQFGDLLASISLFRAIKERYPNSHLTVILSPQNHYGIDNCKLIDRPFIFDKKRILDLNYLREVWNLLREKYDLSIVPVTVSVSSTSCIMGRITKAKYRIGPNSLDGKSNDYSCLFNKRVDLNWSKNPNRHVADFSLDIVRPFEITTKDLKSQIDYSEQDKKEAEDFITRLLASSKEYIIGFHIGAGKPPNRWDVKNFVKLITKLDRNYNFKIYFTGSNSDKEQLDELEKSLSLNASFLINKPIPVLAAVIDQSDLFITNDTGVMHVAGATSVNQVSIFGPTNPNNWAPIGENKVYLKKDDDINSVTVDMVYDECVKFLN